MEILHISAECYPVAKAGGLGDVVGALPKYQLEAGHIAKVLMPMYRTPYLYNHEWEVVHQGYTNMGSRWFNFTIIKEKSNELGFDLYLMDIHQLLDREKIYGYSDDTERFVAFQIAALDWVSSWRHSPSVIHVHDHHTGLIPFMLRECYKYRNISHIPVVFTIHNAEYQGIMGWDKSYYLPEYNTWNWGKLDWNNAINALAAGVKSADRVTTVSPSYLQQLKWQSNGLESLFEMETGKCFGILNGIDKNVWNPETDRYLEHTFKPEEAEAGKLKNKYSLCDDFGLDYDKPMIVFIGRLVGEKGAEILPDMIRDCFEYIGRKMNFLILGSGMPEIEHRLNSLKELARNDYNVYIGYNEQLSHRMYAGADFLLMPSRVEPCGLNQMYAMRYGTMPMVRRTGGLKDTVTDFGEAGGYGICFNDVSVGDASHAVWRAVELYRNKEKMKECRDRMMQLDFGWERSAEEYLKLYQQIN
jgi:starch synthase